MNHYGTLRDFRFSEKDIDDIRGSDVYGRDDEKLGEIDDVIFDHSTGDIRNVVIDAGGWLSGKKFTVPAEHLQPSPKHADDYYIPLSKKEVESFPKYDEDAVRDSDRWKDYESRYNGAWDSSGGVMHREEEPDKIVTPTTREMPTTTTARTSSTRTSDYRPDLTPERLVPTNDMPTTVGAYEGGGIMHPHLGQRWHNFQSNLRRDRSRITSSCNVCSIGPKSSISEADRKRKVG